MASKIIVNEIGAPTTGANANKIIVGSGQKIVGTDAVSVYAPGTVVNMETVEVAGTSANQGNPGSFTDTGVSLTVTPKLTNSKFTVVVHQVIAIDDGTNHTRVDFRALAVQDSNTTEIYRMDYYGHDGQSPGRVMKNCSGSGVYTNTTGNQITFKTQVQAANGQNNSECGLIHMRWYDDSKHTITVLEIAQ